MNATLDALEAKFYDICDVVAEGTNYEADAAVELAVSSGVLEAIAAEHFTLTVTRAYATESERKWYRNTRPARERELVNDNLEFLRAQYEHRGMVWPL